MLVRSLGHVVLKVRDLRRSEAFYAGVLGMQVISRISEPVAITFFTLGNHHDFALIEVGAAAPRPDGGTTGLAHVAFKVGDSPDELRRAEAALDAAGIAPLYVAERAFTKSLHVEDPDGHEVELYVDTSDAWTMARRINAGPDHEGAARRRVGRLAEVVAQFRIRRLRRRIPIAPERPARPVSRHDDAVVRLSRAERSGRRRVSTAPSSPVLRDRITEPDLSKRRRLR